MTTGSVALLRGALQDELAHARGVGLTPHGLHDRADDGAGGLHLAVADLREHVGLRLQRLVDGGDERAVVGHDRQAAGVHDLLRRALAVDDALDHVAGYTLLNDVSARDWQNRTSQWTLGKNFDGFAPLGPAVVTADEIPDPTDLLVEAVRDGQVTLSQSTSTLIFPFAELVAYISQAVTLRPGDVISTGTPQKLATAFATHRPLADGDEVTIRAAGIGELTTRFVAPPSAGAPHLDPPGAPAAPQETP